MTRKFLRRLFLAGSSTLLGVMCLAAIPSSALAQQSAPTEAVDLLGPAEIRSAQFAKAFDAAQTDELVKMFAADAEFVDEEGNIYQGSAEIQALFTAFFEKFAGAKLTTQVDSIRPIGKSMLVEEGTRTITTADTSTSATQRYLMVLAKDSADAKGDTWKISMVREFAQDAPATHLDYLMPLSMLEGEWVDENPSGATRVHYHWNEEKTFLLGEYTVQIDGRPAMKSSQRLGWDPVQQKIRSWTFDADGGFSEGFWTPTENGWIVKSTATLPSGEVGSATLIVTLLDDDRISVSSRDRVIGDVVEEPFEIQIVRRPPAPAK